MTIFIKGHSFGYELQRVAQMFFPGEKVSVVQGEPDAGFTGDFLLACLEDGRLRVDGRIGGGPVCHIQEDALPSDAPGDLEHKFGLMLYRLASRATGIAPQWGVLTGVRPVKLVASHMRRGMDEAALRDYFMGGCLVSANKFDLALETARVEQEILAKSTPDSFSLYVSIPFCPTRCAYCSFVSHSVEQAAKLIPDYVDRLCMELADTARIAAGLKLKLRTVYFGGGTPTALSTGQLRRIMGAVAEYFDLSEVWEYTVEAGRPDTITAEKLRAVREGGAGRISINPQTLSDSVLETIGRKHTTKQLFDSFAIARECGFKNINMDLIAGLPTDTPDGFKASVDGVIALSPENITVHTLTVKRASRLTFEQARDELRAVSGMVDYAQAAVKGAGYRPYYLYRQNGSLSSLENVGYAKAGREGLYNVYIMDETHSIFADGAGASTKLRHPVTGAIERVYNYKYPYEYIRNFREAARRKERIAEFYRQGYQD